MEGIQSSVVLCTLLLAIFGPTGSFGNKRTCFCETAWRPSGSGSSSDTELFEITNPVYRRSLYLGCSGPREWCPRDCKAKALETMGGSRSSFTTEAGNSVCYRYGRDRPCPGISVWAKYVVSNCGARATIRLASNVCCAIRSFRCSCDLMVSMEGRLPVSLQLPSYNGAEQGPYYDCNDKEEINSACKNECINHYSGILEGPIFPHYNLTSSTMLCKELGTILPPGARVYIQHSTVAGDPKTDELERLCCVSFPGMFSGIFSVDCVLFGK